MIRLGAWNRVIMLLLAAAVLCGIAPREESVNQESDNRPYLQLPKRTINPERRCTGFRESLCAECNGERSCVHLCCHRRCDEECNFGDPRAKACHKSCEAWRDGEEPSRPY